MPYATLNGIRFHFETQGRAIPLLLINGLSAPAANWLFSVRDCLPLPGGDLDNRGVGETDMPDASVYPTTQMADDAAASRPPRIRRRT